MIFIIFREHSIGTLSLVHPFAGCRTRSRVYVSSAPHRRKGKEILSSSKNVGAFEYEIIADRKRITKESFERWYAGQSKYRKLCDRSTEEQEHIEQLRKEAEQPRLMVPDDKPAYNLQETAILLDLTYNEVRELIRSGDLEAKKYGNKVFVRRDDIQWFLFQQKLNSET